MSTIVQPDDQTISQQRAVPTSIRKRDGRVIRFDSTKIVEAVMEVPQVGPMGYRAKDRAAPWGKMDVFVCFRI